VLVKLCVLQVRPSSTLNLCIRGDVSVLWVA
jgi:hypothetical protein